MRILIAAASPSDRARIEALVADVPDATVSTEPGGEPDLAITDVASLAALPAELPAIVLVHELTEDAAGLVHRYGARVGLFAHGPAPLRHAIDRIVYEAAHDRLRALVNLSVTDVVFHLRVEGNRFRFTEINPAFLAATGLTEAQVRDRFVDEVIPEPSRSLVLGKYREAIAGGRTVRWDETSDYPTGRKHGQVSVTPVVDARGRCLSLIGTVRDVTDARRASDLEAAERRVLQLVASGAPLAATLDALVRAIEPLVVPAIASVLLVSPDGQRVLHGAAPNLPDEYNRAIHGAAIGPTAGSCGAAAALREPVIARDIDEDPRWDGYRHLARPHGLRACWSTPIMAGSGRVLGTFALYHREPHDPTAAEQELIARVTHVAGIALQRHELDEQLRGLAAHIDAAREDERTGIAREIHDQLGQALTLLKVDLAWIARRAAGGQLAPEQLRERLAEVGGLADSIIQDVRRISTELRPAILDDVGLDAALAWQADEFTRRTKIPCAVRSGLTDDERVDRAVATAVFRVFQEALANVIRHAGATRVDVRIEETARALVLTVEDDGEGIADDKLHDPRSLGLLGMRERARRLGGSIAFARRAPRGTVVTLELPRSV